MTHRDGCVTCAIDDWRVPVPCRWRRPVCCRLCVSAATANCPNEPIGSHRRAPSAAAAEEARKPDAAAADEPTAAGATNWNCRSTKRSILCRRIRSAASKTFKKKLILIEFWQRSILFNFFFKWMNDGIPWNCRWREWAWTWGSQSTTQNWRRGAKGCGCGWTIPATPVTCKSSWFRTWGSKDLLHRAANLFEWPKLFSQWRRDNGVPSGHLLSFKQPT